MDQSSFDRIARLLGGETTRRAGMRSALGGLLGLGAVEAAEARNAAGSGKGKGKGKGKDTGRTRGKPDVEGPCGDRSRKDNLCTDDQQCCTGYCEKKVKNKDGKGRCRCIRRDEACKSSQTCCGGLQCTNNVCGPEPIPTGQLCKARDVCRSKDASCTSYTAPGEPQAPRCLLPLGKACSANSQCVSALCSGGVCVACSLIPTGSPQTCTANADCCSGFCTLVDDAGVDVGRCVSEATIWMKLSWTADQQDLDSWTWLPQAAVNASGTASSFPAGGDVVMWQRPIAPFLADALDPLDSYSAPKKTPGAWLDVDALRGPAAERTLIFQPMAGVYRYAVHNFGACSNDGGSPNACGAGWADLDTSWPALPGSGAVVEVYRGASLLRTFTVPTTVVDPANPEYSYWWHVTDITYDKNGEFVSLTPGGGQPNGVLKECAPVPYPMNTFVTEADILPVSDAEGDKYSNFCPL